MVTFHMIYVEPICYIKRDFIIEKQESKHTPINLKVYFVAKIEFRSYLTFFYTKINQIHI